LGLRHIPTRCSRATATRPTAQSERELLASSPAFRERRHRCLAQARNRCSERRAGSVYSGDWLYGYVSPVPLTVRGAPHGIEGRGVSKASPGEPEAGRERYKLIRQKALARGDCALAEDGCCRRSRNEGFLDQKASCPSLASSPALCERRHRRLARRFVAVPIEDARPKNGRRTGDGGHTYRSRKLGILLARQMRLSGALCDQVPQTLPKRPPI
jgi:hypothetical protein